MPGPFPVIVPTPGEVARALGERVEALRLGRDWKRDTLAARSGVSASTIKRFERTGTITLDGLLRLCAALDRLNDFEPVLAPPPAASLAELERSERPPPRRGRR